MTKEELVAFLKDNLKVVVSTLLADYRSNEVKVQVSLMLNDEDIASDYDYIYIPDSN